MSRPDALKFVRCTILDIINQYKIDYAGLRITESNAQKLSIERIETEGVIKECFASSSLKKFYCGQISNITAKIGIERNKFKPYVDGKENFEQVENWNKLSKEGKEAVLTAIGAENVGI